MRNEELFRIFRQAIDKIRGKGGISMLCSVLPRRGFGAEWLSRAIAVNYRLANHCKCNEWTFIDNRDLFYGKVILYSGMEYLYSLRVSKSRLKHLRRN